MEYVRVFNHANKTILFLLLIGISLLLGAAVYFFIDNEIFIIGIILVLLFSAVKIVKKIRQTNITIPGVEGDEIVREEVSSLPSGYYHVYEFNFENKNKTDIVVIGLTGVWTIEVKNYAGGEIAFEKNTLLKNGIPFHKDLLKEAQDEANNAKRFIDSLGVDTPVTPILLFTNKHMRITFEEPKNGVYIITLPMLNKLIQNQPLSLSDAQGLDLYNKMKKFASIL